jgi:hypothetical protein
VPLAVGISKNQRQPPPWLLIYSFSDLAQLFCSGRSGTNLDLHDDGIAGLPGNQVRMEVAQKLWNGV